MYLMINYMFVCIPSKDNTLLYNIFEEEAGSHSNSDSIPNEHKNTCYPFLGISPKIWSAVPSGQVIDQQQVM